MYVLFVFILVKKSNHQDIRIMCRTIIELATDPKNRLDLWLQRIIVGWNKDQDLIDGTNVLARELSSFLGDKHSQTIKHFPHNLSVLIDPEDNFELMKNMIDYIVTLDA